VSNGLRGPYQRRLEAIVARVERDVPGLWARTVAAGDPAQFWIDNGYPVVTAAAEATVDVTGGMVAGRLGGDAARAVTYDAIDYVALQAGIRILRAQTVDEAAPLGPWLAGQHTRDIQWVAGRALAGAGGGRRVVRVPDSRACDFCREIASQSYGQITDVSVHESCRCGWDYLDDDDFPT